MQIDTFKRIIRTFADPQTPMLIERERAMIQVYGDLIEVGLKQYSGEVFIADGVDEVPANIWIINRLARLPLLASRLIATVPVTRPFVRPEGELLQSLELKPGAEPEHVDDALAATLSALDHRSPLETTVLYITSDAGEGKTSLINEMARHQAERFNEKRSDWLLVPIPLGGRHFLRFDDVTVGVLQNRYRFPFFYYNSFLELVRLGVLIPAYDGFEEMFVESSSGEALSAMGNLVSNLKSSGALVVAARKAYFEFQNLKTQARLYDTIREFSVGFGKLSLERWKREQFLDYCLQRKLPDAEALYEKVIGRLGREHSLITRPVLVRRLVDIAEHSVSLDEFLTKLHSSGADFFAVFVRGIVEREALDVWLDRSGEVAQPLLTVEEHCQLLSLLALEMWQSRVDFLKPDVLEFETDFFCERNHKPAGISGQIKERIKAHALLVSSPNGAGALEFDHDEFRQYFLGEGIAGICLSQTDGRRGDVLNILRKGLLPDQAFTAAVQAIRRLGSDRLFEIASTLAEIALLDGQTSFTHENAASMIIALLSGQLSPGLVLRRLSFPPNSLREIQLANITFLNCFFAQSSLESTQLTDCKFTACQFVRLDGYASTKVQNVVVENCEVDGFTDVTRGLSFYEPAVVKAQLVEFGFAVPDAAAQLPLTMQKSREPDEALVQFEKLVRYCGRSTHMSENVIRAKLGVRSNTFLSDTVPLLIRHGILTEVKHTGGGQQLRVKLGRPMSAIGKAIEESAGSFDTFLAKATA